MILPILMALGMLAQEPTTVPARGLGAWYIDATGQAQCFNSETQSWKSCEAPKVEWVPPEPPPEIMKAICAGNPKPKDSTEDCKPHLLKFWRIKGGGAWHLYNKEDKVFLQEWKGVVEWTVLEGKLPK